MPTFALAFLCGDLLLQTCTFLPSRIWIGIAILFCIYIYQKQIPYTTLFIPLLLGFSWSLWHASHIAHFSLPLSWEGKTIYVTGKIHSLPQITNQQTSFLFNTSKIQDQNIATILRLTWRNPSHALKVGDQWQLPVHLKKIHSTMNPGGFDYEAYAFLNKIRASGYILENEHPLLLSSARYTYFIDRLRQHIQQTAAIYLPVSQTSPWIIALMLGERIGIPKSEWAVLRNTGTNHLMAIAGLHIGFIAAMTYTLISRLWRLFPRLLLSIPASQAGICVSLAMALFYSALAGFSIPTQRASIMICILLITALLRRIIPAWHAWSFALLVVLIINPLSVLSSSFWLSFTTIALIIYGMSGRLKSNNLWWKWGRPQWVIALGLLPLSLWLFTQYSLVSFIANSIAIPWVGFLILPLCFLSVLLLLVYPPLTAWTLIAADKSLALLWSILTCLSHLPGSVWQQPMPHYGLLIAAIIGMIILLAPQGLPGRGLGLFWLLPLIVYKPLLPSKGEIQFTLLDVGQGLSAVVQTQQHTLVYDTGAKFGLDYDMGESVVLPFLHSQGIKQLDMLVVSHGDNDHSGGASSILQQMPVKNILTSVPEFFTLQQAEYCLSGRSWEWDGVRFSFIYPTMEKMHQGNNSSCVLQIKTAKQSVLLAGDIEKEAEKFLLNNTKNDLSADIIIAPHHGSKTSALREFIGHVHPQYVLYAVGYRNHYHFPHPAVVQAYSDWGTVQYDTATAGAMQFILGKEFIPRAILYRKAHKKYWHD